MTAPAADRPLPTLHGIKACDTMKKARAWLDGHGVAYAFHDYKAAGVDPAALRRWAALVGWETLLNRNGTTFRALPPEARADLDEDRAIALMAAQPSMIKRPVLVLPDERTQDGGTQDGGSQGGRLLVGFKPETWAAVLAP